MKKEADKLQSGSMRGQEGMALLAVLWLSVALSVMAMTTAYLVRTEAEAVSNQIEAQRSYYLARGGIEAAMDSILRAGNPLAGNPMAADLSRLASGQPAEFHSGQRWLRYEFSEGSAAVEVVPENAKLNVNQIPPELFAALFQVLGLPAIPSEELAAAIVDWRTPRASIPPGGTSPFDLFYAGLPQPYAARHAPVEELEELLGVKGMTRDLFFGRMERSAEGSWRKLPPLVDLLTTELSFGVNLNYAPYEVLRVLPGWDASLAEAIVEARTRAPFDSLEELQSALPAVSTVRGLAPFTLSAGPVYTLTATGWLSDSAVRRSVRARVRLGVELPLAHRVVAWWEDWPWSTQVPPADILQARERAGSR